jgi:hypothetical protein
MALPPVRRREGRSIPVTSRGRVRVDSGNGTSGSAATISATLPPNASPCIPCVERAMAENAVEPLQGIADRENWANWADCNRPSIWRRSWAQPGPIEAANGFASSCLAADGINAERTRPRDETYGPRDGDIVTPAGKFCTCASLTISSLALSTRRTLSVFWRICARGWNSSC